MRLSLTSINFDSHGSGYGRLGREIAQSLTALGHEVEAHDDSKETVPAIALYPQLPMHVDEFYEGQKTCAITMFETNQLPDPFIEVLGNYDRILVPCEMNLRLFSQHHPDVRKVPLGVNPAQWIPKHGDKPSDRGAPYTFLCAGNGWWRKGFHIAVEAFKLADLPNTRLILKGNGEEYYKDLKEQYIQDDKRIILLREWLTEEAQVLLYQDADCYLGPSMGEGWGLQPHQAIACGVPAIITAAAGHMEFIQYATPLRWHKEPANYGNWGPCGEWWVPTAEDLAEAMVREYKNPTPIRKRLENAEYIRRLNWNVTALSILANLLDWDDTPIPRGKKRKFEHKLFPIETTEDFYCEIAWKPLAFEKGKEYWVTADVKRVLYEAKKLTKWAARVEPGGLLPRQIEGDYEPGPCPMCGRPFESSLDEPYEKLGEKS